MSIHIEQCTHAMHRAMLPSNATYERTNVLTESIQPSSIILSFRNAGRAYVDVGFGQRIRRTHERAAS